MPDLFQANLTAIFKAIGYSYHEYRYLSILIKKEFEFI